MAVIPTRKQLTDLFGADEVVRVPQSALPDGVTDTFTRTFLTEVGLPRKTVSYFVEITDLRAGLRTLPEAPPFVSHDWEVPTGFAGHFYLGETTGGQVGQIVLDGATGTVYFLSESGVGPFVLSSSVGALSHAMYVLLREKHLYSQEYFEEHNPALDDDEELVDTYGAAAERIRLELAEADPAALATPGNPWDTGLAEISAGIWG